jgi:hypothetical protein
MKKTIEVINELKKERLFKDYAIGGAIGVLKWVEPFFTRDLDIFIIPIVETKEGVVNLSPIYEYLKKKGCYWKGQWLIIEGTPVDFIPVDALEKEAVENAQVTEFEGVETKVIIPEYLVALLLKTGRDKDMRKIEMLLGQARIDKGRLDKILAEYGLTEKFIKFKEARDGK